MTRVISKSSFTVNLNDSGMDAQSLLFLTTTAKDNGGATVEELAVYLNKSINVATYELRQLRKFPNVQVKKVKGDKYYAIYSPPVVETVSAATVIPEVDPRLRVVIPKKNLLPRPQQTEPAQVTQTLATEVIWPKAPDILSVSSDFSFFSKPFFYDHMVKKITEHGKNIRIFGPPGIGKSVAAEYCAAYYGIPLACVNAEAGLRARQLIGGMTDNRRFEVTQFAAAVVKGYWALINEVNAMDPDAALILNGLTAPPYQIIINGISYSKHPSFRLIVTYNPGLIGTKPIPPSLADRFYPIRVKFPEKATLNKMLKTNGVDVAKEEVQQLEEFALRVAKQREDGKHRWDITLRRLLDAYTDLKDGYTIDEAVAYSMISGIDSVVDQKVVDDIYKNYVNEVKAAAARAATPPPPNVVNINITNS